VQQPVGGLCEGLQMNDEESDGGGLFIALAKVVIAVFFFCLFVAVVAGIVWGLIA